MAHWIGSYKVVQKIASGGMGTVYVALQSGPAGFSRAVAIKQLHPHLEVGDKWRRRFAGEARIGAQLAHPNIVSVLDFGKDTDGDYIVMEYVSGCSLARLLAAREEPLRQVQAALIAREVLAGLGAAHSFTGPDGAPMPVIHRDVNPRNVLLSLQGEVKVTDFGIASIAGRPLTTVGALRGTLAYMSPEQARRQPLDARTDIFAAGLLLFELLTGRRAYAGRDETQMLALAKEGMVPLQLIEQIDDELRQIVSRAVRFSADERFADARSFRDALDAFLDRSGRPKREELAELALADNPTGTKLLADEARESERVTRVEGSSGVPRNTPRPARQRSDPERSTRSRSAVRRLPVALIVGLVLAGAAVGGVMVFSFLPGGPDQRAAPSGDTGSSAASSTRRADALDRGRSDAAPRSSSDARRAAVVADRGAPATIDAGRAAAPPPRGHPRRHLRRHRPRAGRRRAKGKLVINTLPVWSRVWIDGKPRGPTPLRLTLPAGLHRVTVRPLGRGARRTLSVDIRRGRATVKIIRVKRPR